MGSDTNYNAGARTPPIAYTKTNSRLCVVPCVYPLLRTGPVLRVLGLSTPPTGRDEALRLFDLSAEDVALNAYVKLMGQPRFSQIDFSIVEAHVPFLKRTSVDAKEEEIQSEKERVRLTFEKSIFSSLMLPATDLFFDEQSKPSYG